MKTVFKNKIILTDGQWRTFKVTKDMVKKAKFIRKYPLIMEFDDYAVVGSVNNVKRKGSKITGDVFIERLTTKALKSLGLKYMTPSILKGPRKPIELISISLVKNTGTDSEEYRIPCSGARTGAK